MIIQNRKYDFSKDTIRVQNTYNKYYSIFIKKLQLTPKIFERYPCAFIKLSTTRYSCKMSKLHKGL